MAKTTDAARAPRGTKIVARAFFTAASEIAEAHRPAVIKAALAAIRDELKVAREKAAVAKAKAKGPTRATSATPARKPVGRPKGSTNAAKKALPFATKMKSKPAKGAPVKRGRKPQAEAAARDSASDQTVSVAES